MERLNSKKFPKLSEEEMRRIEGGGWRVDAFKVYYDPYTNCNKSNIIMQRYTLLGNPTGEYHNKTDVCA